MSSLSQLMYQAIRKYCKSELGDFFVPAKVRLESKTGQRISLIVPPDLPDQEFTKEQDKRTARTRDDRPPSHSPDFRGVNWFGKRFAFTPTQAAVIKILWEARIDGSFDVGGAYLLENSGSESARLPDVFQRHPAWKTLILPGSTQGTYHLPEGAIETPPSDDDLPE